MTDHFARAVKTVLEHEGYFSDRKTDRGGKTKFGITERVARAHGYAGEMRDMPVETAKAIYKRQYWDTLRLDEIAAMSYPIALELFDTGVNMGIAVATRMLQRVLNVFNKRGSVYADMTVDGVLGPVSVAAMRDYLRERGSVGEVVLLRALNSLQGARYVDITEGDPDQEDYTFGWFVNRVRIA